MWFQICSEEKNFKYSTLEKAEKVRKGGNIVSFNTINQFSTQKLLKIYDGNTFHQTFKDMTIYSYLYFCIQICACGWVKDVTSNTWSDAIHRWLSTTGYDCSSLTDGLHHAGLSCVRFHRNDVLKTVQRDDTLSGSPHLENVLHFWTKFLLKEEKQPCYLLIPSWLNVLIILQDRGVWAVTLADFSPR